MALKSHILSTQNINNKPNDIYQYNNKKWDNIINRQTQSYEHIKNKLKNFETDDYRRVKHYVYIDKQPILNSVIKNTNNYIRDFVDEKVWGSILSASAADDSNKDRQPLKYLLMDELLYKNIDFKALNDKQQTTSEILNIELIRLKRQYTESQIKITTENSYLYMITSNPLLVCLITGGAIFAINIFVMPYIFASPFWIQCCTTILKNITSKNHNMAANAFFDFFQYTGIFNKVEVLEMQQLYNSMIGNNVQLLTILKKLNTNEQIYNFLNHIFNGTELLESLNDLKIDGITIKNLNIYKFFDYINKCIKKRFNIKSFKDTSGIVDKQRYDNIIFEKMIKKMGELSITELGTKYTTTLTDIIDNLTSLIILVDPLNPLDPSIITENLKITNLISELQNLLTTNLYTNKLTSDIILSIEDLLSPTIPGIVDSLKDISILDESILIFIKMEAELLTDLNLESFDTPFSTIIIGHIKNIISSNKDYEKLIPGFEKKTEDEKVTLIKDFIKIIPTDIIDQAKQMIKIDTFNSNVIKQIKILLSSDPLIKSLISPDFDSTDPLIIAKVDNIIKNIIGPKVSDTITYADYFDDKVIEEIKNVLSMPQSYFQLF